MAWSVLKQDDWDLQRIAAEAQRGDIETAMRALGVMGSRPTGPGDHGIPARLRRFNATVAGQVRHLVGSPDEPPTGPAIAAAVSELRDQVAELQASIQDEGVAANRRAWIGTLLVIAGLAVAIAVMASAR